MPPQSVHNTASPPFFAPTSMDALWTLLTSPHPVVGKARHLGEALINAGMISPADLHQALTAQQIEREQGHNPRGVVGG